MYTSSAVFSENATRLIVISPKSTWSVTLLHLAITGGRQSILVKCVILGHFSQFFRAKSAKMYFHILHNFHNATYFPVL